MNNQRIWILVVSLFLAHSLWAGSRGVSLAFLDATTGKRSAASLRLGELLEKDMRALYLDPQVGALFPANENSLELQVLKPSEVDLSFDSLLNPKDSKKIVKLIEKIGYPDGLIVFYHDPDSGYVRFKLYTRDGQEALLIRLPLEGKESAMPNSLLQGPRRGALVALGASVRWSP